MATGYFSTVVDGKLIEWQMVVTNEAKEAVLKMRFSLSEPGSPSSGRE